MSDVEKTREELAEEYSIGKAHEHYNFLFEQNAGTPQDFAKLCFLDGFEAGFERALWIKSLDKK